MTIFTFHLAETDPLTTVRALCFPPARARVGGLHHAEVMTRMTLGAGIVSPERMQLRHLAVFAAWEDALAVDRFLAETRLGRTLAGGWHVRMTFLRRWGHLRALDSLTGRAEPSDPAARDPQAPVVAVTVARMKLLQVPRFVHWGRPVEKLVRDHPGQTLAMAAMRLPRTVCTFSVWTSQQEMVNMVHGRSAVPEAERHAVAMVERRRRPFHTEFTTLRFQPLSEHGSWKGRDRILPKSTPARPPRL